MDAGSNPSPSTPEPSPCGQAEYPEWIKPERIAEAKQVLRASNRPCDDRDAINLLIAIGRLLDAAGTLKGNRP